MIQPWISRPSCDEGQRISSTSPSVLWPRTSSLTAVATRTSPPSPPSATSLSTAGVEIVYANTPPGPTEKLPPPYAEPVPPMFSATTCTSSLPGST